MDKQVEFTVSFWTIAKILLAFISIWAIFFLRDILLILLTAVVIASAVEAVAVFLVRRGWPYILAVVLVYIVVVLLLAVFFYFIIPPLFADLTDLISTLPDYIGERFFEEGSRLGGFQSAVLGLAEGVSLTQIFTSLSSALATGSGGFFQAATMISGGVWNLFLIFILSFYLSAQKDGVEKFLRLVAPTEKEVYIIRLWKRSQLLIGRWIQGQFLLGVMVGLGVYLGLILLGVRHALLLAVLAALFELIPVFGALFAAIPGIAIGLLDGGLGKGLIVAALYTVVQQLESNVVYPLVVKKIIGVPPLVVVLSLLVGYQLGGILGIVLAVPMAAVILEAIYDYQKKPIVQEKVELIS
jgi:predicted PurR-regulated permease PerM